MPHSTRSVGFDQRLDDGVEPSNANKATEYQSAEAEQEHGPLPSYRPPAMSKMMCVVPPECSSESVSIP